MAEDIKVVIPARFGSTRFPGKPLTLIAGEPMILRVVERAALAGLGEVIVATDDERIRALCESNSIRCVLTAVDHATGTDRLAEVAEKMGWSEGHVVVNLQGDEPLMPPELLRQVANLLLDNPLASIATLSTKITNKGDIFDANIVKVVKDSQGFAMYFSRAPIPWDRNSFPDHAEMNCSGQVQRHLGIYAYRVGFLKKFPSLLAPAIETQECLEQLRALWFGERIVVGEAGESPGPGVDTPDDVHAVEAALSRGKAQ